VELLEEGEGFVDVELQLLSEPRNLEEFSTPTDPIDGDEEDGMDVMELSEGEEYWAMVDVK
jgi:hypothetical protein